LAIGAAHAGFSRRIHVVLRPKAFALVALLVGSESCWREPAQVRSHTVKGSGRQAPDLVDRERCDRFCAAPGVRGGFGFCGATRVRGGFGFCGATRVRGGFSFCCATRVRGGFGLCGATRVRGGLDFCGATRVRGGAASRALAAFLHLRRGGRGK